jgi:predicted nucleic acid-binding protein
LASRARKVVVDSDVLIAVLRGDARLAGAIKRCAATAASLAVTPVNVAEIFAGVRRGEEARTRVFLGTFACLRVDRAVGETAGAFLARHGASHGLRLADAVVAACAVVHGHRLFTLHREHYPMREVRFHVP